MGATTTDTEPEMREFNLGPIGSDKKLKKQQKVKNLMFLPKLSCPFLFRPYIPPVKRR